MTYKCLLVLLVSTIASPQFAACLPSNPDPSSANIANHSPSDSHTPRSPQIARAPPPDDEGLTPPYDNLFDTQYRDQLYKDINDYADNVESNTFGLKHSVDESLDVVIDAYDSHITNLGQSMRIRKALIQAESFWEYWKQTPLDNIADAGVESYYSWKHSYDGWEKLPWYLKAFSPAPVMPITAREDSSTGISQIFAKTGIRARNWGTEKSVIYDPQRSESNWMDVENVWRALHDDGNFNIGTVPLVLLQGAEEKGVDGIRFDYTDAELQTMFARYNGEGEEAEAYGKELLGVYKIFDKYNEKNRTLK